MKEIEIHIDFSCPFSYIAGERMIQFLEAHKAPLTNIRFRSFQLQPNDDNQHPSYINNRFLTSGLKNIDEYRDFFNNGVGKAAKAIGLNYDVDSIISVNSIHAHMGLQYAMLFDKQAEYFRKVMSAHFEKGKNFYDFALIDDILSELGLDTRDFHNHEEKMKNLVANDISIAVQRGVQSVPTFYQNKIVLQGTGSIEKFESFMF